VDVYADTPGVLQFVLLQRPRPLGASASDEALAAVLVASFARMSVIDSAQMAPLLVAPQSTVDEMRGLFRQVVMEMQTAEAEAEAEAAAAAGERISSGSGSAAPSPPDALACSSQPLPLPPSPSSSWLARLLSPIGARGLLATPRITSPILAPLVPGRSSGGGADHAQWHESLVSCAAGRRHARPLHPGRLRRGAEAAATPDRGPACCASHTPPRCPAPHPTHTTPSHPTPHPPVLQAAKAWALHFRPLLDDMQLLLSSAQTWIRPADATAAPSTLVTQAAAALGAAWGDPLVPTSAGGAVGQAVAAAAQGAGGQLPADQVGCCQAGPPAARRWQQGGAAGPQLRGSSAVWGGRPMLKTAHPRRKGCALVVGGRKGCLLVVGGSTSSANRHPLCLGCALLSVGAKHPAPSGG